MSGQRGTRADSNKIETSLVLLDQRPPRGRADQEPVHLQDLQAPRHPSPMPDIADTDISGHPAARHHHSTGQEPGPRRPTLQPTAGRSLRLRCGAGSWAPTPSRLWPSGTNVRTTGCPTALAKADLRTDQPRVWCVGRPRSPRWRNQQACSRRVPASSQAPLVDRRSEHAPRRLSCHSLLRCRRLR